MKQIALILVALLCLTMPVYAAEMSDWAKAEYEKAKKAELLPLAMESMDLRENINRTEFAAVSVKLYEALSGKDIKAPAENPFTDTKSEDVLKAYAVGITTGLGDGIFGADALLTREQAATMLSRTYEKSMNGKIAAKTDKPFADDDEISPWAKDSVYFMAEKGIIKGVDESCFAPKANTTKEQALAISVRTFDAFGKKAPENLRKFMPAITFGTEVEEVVYEGNTMVRLTGVSDNDFFAYVELIKGNYPNEGFHQIADYGKFYHADNGKYAIEINCVDGNATVTVKDIASDR